MLRLIAAIDDKRGLATDDGIPWDVPADRRYFRRTTTGAAVLMGFRTYQEFAEPMPERRNLVATRRTAALTEGFSPVADVRALLAEPGGGDIWVIGGAGLFEATIGIGDELYLTRIEGDFHCTKFFPLFEEDFVLIAETSPRVDGPPAARFERWLRVRDRPASAPG